MTALVLFLLIVACAILWSRVATLEKQLADLRETLFAGMQRNVERGAPPPAQAFEIPPAPVRTAPAPDEFIPTPAPPPPAKAPPVIPVVEKAPEPGPVEKEVVPQEAPARRSLGFEDIFGRYLPIWAGGITLAVAGFLIVKYSIDRGLLSPAIRVVLGLLFGTGLIAGAEVALRKHAVVGDPRIRQALAGAGIATLYASILVAANLYHLVDPMTAFIGLAAVTALAAGLSLRFGAPSAVLGLVGGLAAPALVGADSPNVPLLATYLALTVGGLCALGRSQRWWWLGALAVLGGFGWGTLLILSGLNDVASVLAVGTLTLLFALAFPMLLLGDRGPMMRLAAAVAGSAQMAAIVATGGFAPLEWGMFALFSAAIVFLAQRQSLFARAPIIGLFTGALLIVAWTSPTTTMLATVITGGALIYGGPALWTLWRSDGSVVEALQVAGIALGIALLPMLHFWGTYGWQSFALLALAGAAISAFAAALGWRHLDRLADGRFAMVAVTGIGLALLAAALALPVWALAPATAVAAFATLMLGVRSQDARIDRAAYGFGIAGLLFLLTGNGFDEAARSARLDAPGLIPLHGVIRWIVPSAVLLAFARWSRAIKVRPVMQGCAVLFGYIAAAQLVPATYMALLPAALIAALALVPRERMALPALATAGALSLGWATVPLTMWLGAAGWALIGEPLYVSSLPGLLPVAIRIAAPLAALGLLLWRKPLPERVRIAATVVAGVLGTLVAHILWKQVFAIADPLRFAELGMAERTLWEAILTGAALAAWRFKATRTATALGAAALGHFALFTLGCHNPLFAEQSVGLWLLPAYGLAFALVWLSRHPLRGAIADRIRGGAEMLLILVFALSALSQVFHGSYLAHGEVGQSEQIGRSLLAIALAIGFLQWGIRTSARDWRIASLVLMLGAVGKVFLFDASGLDGLLRIASFAALGFSLIGVGWLYSRYLPDSRLAKQEG